MEAGPQQPGGGRASASNRTGGAGGESSLQKTSAPYSPVHLIYGQKFRNWPTPGSVPYNPMHLIVVKLLYFRFHLCRVGKLLSVHFHLGEPCNFPDIKSLKALITTKFDPSRLLSKNLTIFFSKAISFNI